MRTLSHLGASASTLVLRGLLLRRTRRLLARRRRRSRPLFTPLVELLRLLLLLLRRPFLHWRRWTHQRIPLLLLRRTKLAVLRSRTVWCRLLVASCRFSAILRLRSSLLLVHTRLRPQRRFHQGVVILFAAVRLPKRTKSLLALLWPLILLRTLLTHWSRPRRPNRPHQRLLVQTSAGLRLPLFNGRRPLSGRPHRNHRTAYNRRRWPVWHGPPSAHDTGADRFSRDRAAHRSGRNLARLHPQHVLRCRTRVHKCLTRYNSHAVRHALVDVGDIVNRRVLVNDHRVVDVGHLRDVHGCIGDVDVIHVCPAHVVSRNIDFSRSQREPSNSNTRRKAEARSTTHKSDKSRRPDRTHYNRSWNPEPSATHERPASVVEWRESPRLIFHPRPAPRPNIGPMPIAIRSPTYHHGARTPARAVSCYIAPVAVLVQILVAGHLARNIVRRIGVVFPVVAIECPLIKIIAIRNLT